MTMGGLWAYRAGFVSHLGTTVRSGIAAVGASHSAHEAVARCFVQ